MRSPKHLTPSLKIAFTLSESDCSFSISIFRCQSDLHYSTVSFSRIALPRNRFLLASLATTFVIISIPYLFVNTFFALFFGLTSIPDFLSYLEIPAEHYSFRCKFLPFNMRTFTYIYASSFAVIFEPPLRSFNRIPQKISKYNAATFRSDIILQIFKTNLLSVFAQYRLNLPFVGGKAR